MPRVVARKPLHAGSWYESDPPALGAQLDAWLAAAPPAEPGAPPPRAVIAPHAGHRFCGHIMGRAYAPIAAARDRVRPPPPAAPPRPAVARRTAAVCRSRAFSSL